MRGGVGPGNARESERVPLREWLQPLPRKGPIDRERALVEASRGKRVIHVGFVDAPFFEQKLAARRWLHAKLNEAAASLVGIDASQEGTDAAREMGFEAHAADAQSLDAIEALGVEPADVVIAGELIEHLDAPGPFLEAMKPLVRPNGRLVLTTPNAYKHVNFLAPLSGSELIHPDHAAWHSPATLRTLARRHGWAVEDMAYYHNPARDLTEVRALAPRITGRSANALRLVVAWVSRPLPYWSDGIIAWCRRA